MFLENRFYVLFMLLTLYVISFQEFRSYPIRNKYFTLIRNSKINTVVFLISYIDHTCEENVFCKSFRNKDFYIKNE